MEVVNGSFSIESILPLSSNLFRTILPSIPFIFFVVFLLHGVVVRRPLIGKLRVFDLGRRLLL